MAQRDPQFQPPHGTKLTTIRISEVGWQAVTAEAEKLGISAAEFIREATFFRLGYRWSRELDAAPEEIRQHLRECGLNVDGF